MSKVNAKRGAADFSDAYKMTLRINVRHQGHFGKSELVSTVHQSMTC